MSYPICGTISTKFLPNNIRSLYIDEYKILHCKNGILTSLPRQCVKKNCLIQIANIEFHYQTQMYK